MNSSFSISFHHLYSVSDQICFFLFYGMFVYVSGLARVVVFSYPVR